MSVNPVLHTLYYVVIQVRRTWQHTAEKKILFMKTLQQQQQAVNNVQIQAERLFCISISRQVSQFLKVFITKRMSVWGNCWYCHRHTPLWLYTLWGASRWNWLHQVSHILTRVTSILKFALTLTRQTLSSTGSLYLKRVIAEQNIKNEHFAAREK